MVSVNTLFARSPFPISASSTFFLSPALIAIYRCDDTVSGLTCLFAETFYWPTRARPKTWIKGKAYPWALVKPRTSYSSKSRREAPSSSTSLASLVKPSIQSTPSSSWMSSKALLSIALSLIHLHRDRWAREVFINKESFLKYSTCLYDNQRNN
jgi:hypothetical protein